MKVSKLLFESFDFLPPNFSLNPKFKFKSCSDQVPVVIYELNESAINFISQESYEKALILL